jgi:hypothetical protein
MYSCFLKFYVGINENEMFGHIFAEYNSELHV